MRLPSLLLGTSGLGTRPSGVEAETLADALLAAPYRGLDTSNAYAGGRSEAVLGRAIERAGGLPDGVQVVTKVDADPVTKALDGERVRRSLEESLDKLGLDHLPLLHLHDPYTVSFSEAIGPGGAVDALVALREEGVVDAIGIAAGPLNLLDAYVGTGAFDAVLSHNRFTLVDRGATALFEDARARGMTVINAAPFGGGLLAGSERAAGKYAYKDASPELLAHVDRIRAMCRQWQVPLPAAALWFSRRSPLVDAAVVGSPSLARLDELSAIIAAEPPAAFFVALDELGPAPTAQEAEN